MTGGGVPALGRGVAVVLRDSDTNGGAEVQAARLGGVDRRRGRGIRFRVMSDRAGPLWAVALALRAGSHHIGGDRSPGVSMAEDLLDAIRDQLANFAVGLVKRVEGAGSKVLGSGVLVSIEGRRGILTCGHVAEQYDKLREIGLTRLIA
jgi:hypothetical protein